MWRPWYIVKKGREMSSLSTLPALQCSMALLYILRILYSVHVGWLLVVYWLLGGGVGYNDEQVSQDPAAVGGGGASRGPSREECDAQRAPLGRVARTWSPWSASCVRQQGDHTHRTRLDTRQPAPR